MGIAVRVLVLFAHKAEVICLRLHIPSKALLQKSYSTRCASDKMTQQSSGSVLFLPVYDLMPSPFTPSRPSNNPNYHNMDVGVCSNMNGPLSIRQWENCNGLLLRKPCGRLPKAPFA